MRSITEHDGHLKRAFTIIAVTRAGLEDHGDADALADLDRRLAIARTTVQESHRRVLGLDAAKETYKEGR